MPLARYFWEERGFAEMAARGPEPVPADMAEQPFALVRPGHGVVLSGAGEYRAAREALDAWYLRWGGRTMSQAETDELYGMCLSGEESLLRPLVFYMARWRAYRDR